MKARKTKGRVTVAERQNRMGTKESGPARSESAETPKLRQARLHVSSHRNLQYGWTAFILGDKASTKFTEYSKVFTVDGNLHAGTAKLAQQVAEKFGMRYFPEADVHLLDRLTGDGKKLDLKYNGSCCLETFYNEPKHPNGNSYRLQAWMYCTRLLQYADALDHLLSTGQGIVLERSPYSDFVFLEAMSKQGYIHPRCVKHYYRMKSLSICEVLPPHLVIYIDVPVSEVKKRIEKIGQPYEKKVSAAYLQSIEDSYKKSFLPQMSETSEILQYTASEADNVDRIIEDIEILKFDKGPWLAENDVSLHYLRCRVNDKLKMMSPIAVPDYIPEVTIGGLDADEIFHNYRELPGRKYASGYNADVGDKWIWLK
ncbi:NADH dehydrogenase [ubiquinone] 1 alpha subcomplex subunit 10, mitochondrial isoform X1 [Python bivittatus]|uniref:NADH dehydrogenase [ubiquinone] 1 alpha subcomplex subunit 10, mitochondrial n=1 Tax=Python bivittatus TaxID=176946 RepID=A0A9F2R2L3_PYTBI|nr:NADH dehydrogenase [ubiquinone] 1 alpha subcomplex subunit 10, mitochondrial isoform X1 [Python bivittatus]